MIALAFFVAFLLVYLIGWFNLETAQSLAQWAKGMVKFLLHFLFLVAGISLIARRGVQFYWLTLGAFVGGVAANAAYGVAQLAVAEGTGRNLDAGWLQPLTGGASKINIYGAIEGQNVFRINALTGDPNHLGIELAAVLVLMLPIYLRLERGHRYRTPLAVLLGFLFVVELATLSRSGMLGLGCGFLVLLIPYRRHFLTARFLVPLGVVMAGLFVVPRAESRVLRAGHHLATLDGGARLVDALPRLRLHPRRARAAPAVRARRQHVLRLLRVPDGEDELRAALVLRRLVRRDGPRRDARVRGVPRLPVPPGRSDAAHRSRARGDRRPALGARLAARVGPHRGARLDDGLERLLPDDVLLLLLRHRPARDRRARRVRAAPDDRRSRRLVDDGGLRSSVEPSAAGSTPSRRPFLREAGGSPVS